jgi:hypothetical protein
VRSTAIIADLIPAEAEKRPISMGVSLKTKSRLERKEGKSYLRKRASSPEERLNDFMGG